MPQRPACHLRVRVRWGPAAGSLAAMAAMATVLVVAPGCGLGRGGAVAEESPQQPHPPQPSPSPQPPPALTHLPVPAPPAVAAPDPRLWVALAARLGGSQPLVLQAASGSLTLITASGERHQGPQLVVRWRGGVFAGPFRVQADAYGTWTLVEQVPLERYLLGVVPHEIGAGSPPAALAAQAVLARTWALRNQGRYAVDGYHLCSDTQCQVYGDPGQAGPAVRQAVAATRHQVLSWQGEPIHAVYHATNGGVSTGFEEVWDGASLPYLQPRLDGTAALEQRFLIPLAPGQVGSLLATTAGLYGADHPRFRWSRSLDAAQIAAAVRPLAPQLGIPQRLAVLERGPSGRVLALQIQGSGSGPGSSVVLRRDAIRRHLRSLPSTLFLVSPEGPGRWRFQGGGFGHGAGLSQAGAIDLAGRGWATAQILAHYYPGTSLVTLDQLGPAAAQRSSSQEPPGSAP
jgi:SpoIID/LytB domain protein